MYNKFSVSLLHEYFSTLLKESVSNKSDYEVMYGLSDFPKISLEELLINHYHDFLVFSEYEMHKHKNSCPTKNCMSDKSDDFSMNPYSSKDVGDTPSMQYELTCSCGHRSVISLSGSEAERNNKINWFRTKGVCPTCYAKSHPVLHSDSYTEVRMFYGTYKSYYSTCQTKPGSYDCVDKTIVVYVPNDICFHN